MQEYISFTSTELLIAVTSSAIFIVAFILLGKWYFGSKIKSNLTKKYAATKWKSPLEARTKYPDVDVFSWSPVFLRMAMASALIITILAFNWTTYDQKIDIPDNALVIEEDIQIDIPRSAAPPPPPPPPPPPVIQEVPTEAEIELENDFEFVDQSIDAETAVEVPDIVADNSDNKEALPPPPPPPPPPAEPEMEEIFRVVEEMPRFPGCESIDGTMKEKQACAEKKLLEFIYSNIQYPSIARENGIEGNIVVQFVVDQEGKIGNVEILRNLGGGLGEETIRVVKLMNDLPQRWSPGKQRGKAVKVAYILPVKFKLQYN